MRDLLKRIRKHYPRGLNYAERVDFVLKQPLAIE